jgi:hypothetical protein
MGAKKTPKKTQRKNAKPAKTPKLGDLSPKESEAVKGAVSGGGGILDSLILGRKKG